MAKITALDIADELTGDELLPIVQGPTTKRATMRAFRDLITPFLQNWYKGDRGDPGLPDNTFTSYSEMQASDPTRKVARLVNDTDVPPHPDASYNNPSQTIGGWVQQTAQGISSQAAPSTPRLNLDDAREHGVRMSRYGIKANGSALDNKAWQDMVEEFEALGIKRCLFNRGVSGESVVDRPIVDGPLAPGFQLIGEGRNAPSAEFGNRLRIRYIGDDGAAFQIWQKNPDGSKGSTTGDYLFEDIAVICTQPGASAFDINQAATHGSVEDDSPYWYINQVKFRSVMLYGGGGGPGQLGDGIRAAKAFGLEVDEHCFVRDTRRGVWTFGCDEARLSPRGFLNGRQIHNEASGAAGNFGNSTIIACPFYGQPAIASSEPTYQVWDNADKTIIRPALWEADANRNLTAHVFIDGRGTKIERMEAAGVPLFHLGPNAHSCSADFFLNDALPTARPIIDEPVNYDNADRDYRLRITGASPTARAVIGTHPRILWGHVSTGTGGLLAVRQDRPMVAGAKGYAPRQLALTALGTGDYSTLRLVNGAKYVADPDCTSGWGIQLPTGSPGLAFCEFVMGRDLVQGRYIVRTLSKRADTKTYVASALKNGVTFQSLQTVFPATQMTENVHPLDLRNWVDGDVLRYIIQPVDGDANGDFTLDYVFIEALDDYPTAADDTAAAALTPQVVIGQTYFNTTTGALRPRQA